MMAAFNEEERAYLSEPHLGRLATVDQNGRPHVVPTGFRFRPEEGVIDIGGYNLPNTKKFRDASANPDVAFVVDDIVSTDPWQVRGIEIRGRAETIIEDSEDTAGFGSAWIRITPTRIISWGLSGNS